MRLAITGATGGVGTALALAARARGDEVSALVRDRAKAERLARDGVELVQGDLDDKAALARLAKGADAFVHAAAHVGDWGDRETFVRVNVGGTLRAIEAAAEGGARRFVHVSSVAVYGRPSEGNVTEEYPTRVIGSPYEDTKLEAETLAFDEGKRLGLEVAAVRPPVIFGAHDRTFLPRLVAQLRARRVIYIDGGRAPFNCVDVDDVVDVIFRCATMPAAVGEAFNVACSPPPPFRSVVETVADACGIRRPRISLARPTAMAIAKALDGVWKAARAKSPPPITPFVVRLLTLYITYDASKARRVLGWSGGGDPLPSLARAAKIVAS